ncbi:GntR family transcriptional regulator [Pengzhenrongella sicca]|uniref:GntR family transcriptional regulator n=1 Tax=Pengzhenrongella sicca TaxID=2819238 RepID=UPI003873960D
MAQRRPPAQPRPGRQRQNPYLRRRANRAYVERRTAEGQTRREIGTVWRIITLKLTPGALLSENELAAELGMSRTPIRAALMLLSQEGLVQIFPRIGSFVSRVDPQRVADAQFLREAVELASLDDVPAEPDAELTNQLGENLAQQQLVVEGDYEQFFLLDEHFHQ